MRISGKRLHQILIGLLAGLSLFASPAAACVCSHSSEHSAAEAAHSHCEHSAKSKESSETFAVSLLPVDECECIQATPRIAAKQEILQVESQAAALPSRVAIPTPVLISPFFTKPAEVQPVTHSELEYFSKPTRGPPLS